MSSTHRSQRLRRCFLLLSLFFLLPSPKMMSAQAPDYFAPGAIAILQNGNSENFPNDIMARRWLLGFWNHVQEECGIEGEPLFNAATLANPVKVNQYLMLTLPQAAEGAEDAARFARAGCRDARQVATAAETIIVRSIDRVCPVPAEKPAFLRLLSFSARTAFGVGPDGITKDQHALRERLTPAVARYLRTRQLGRMSDAQFREIAREVAERIATSGIGDDLIMELITLNEEGQEIVALYLIDHISSEMRPEREVGLFEEPTMDDRLDQMANDLWEAMGAMMGSQGERSGQEQLTNDCTRRALATLQVRVAEVLPREFQGVFSTRSTNWTPPEPGTAGTVTGVVVIMGTGDAVEGAWVYPRNAGGTMPRGPGDETDESGRFVLKEVTLPEYSAGRKRSREGLEDGMVSVTARFGQHMGGSSLVKVEPGSTVTTRIEIACSIAGKEYYGCEDGVRPQDEAEREGLIAAEQPSHALTGEEERQAWWSNIDSLRMAHGGAIRFDWVENPPELLNPESLCPGFEEYMSLPVELRQTESGRGSTIYSFDTDALLDSNGSIAEFLGDLDYIDANDGLRKSRGNAEWLAKFGSYDRVARTVVQPMEFTPATTGHGTPVPYWIMVDFILDYSPKSGESIRVAIKGIYEDRFDEDRDFLQESYRLSSEGVQKWDDQNNDWAKIANCSLAGSD